MRVVRLLTTLALGLSSSGLASARSVFAHFMVDNASNYTLGDWTTDIQLAQQAHIDAFALNVAYRDNLDSILPLAFQAAANRGFKLFFSFDYAGHGAWPKDSVGTMLTKYRTLPAYFIYKGKYFVSTFEGPDSADDWIDLKSQYNVFFMPDWSSLGAKEALLRGGGVADGLFNWAAWPWGPQDMDTYTDASYLQYLNGKPYMMPVSPWFFTNLPGYNKNWLWRGDSLWYDRWVQAAFNKTTPGIIDSTEFVEIISWNDYGESHYIGPLYDKAMEAFTIGQAPSNFAKDMPHDGWRMFLPYVIDLFKTGTATITQEGLTAWYRLSPGAACVSTGTSGNTASQLQIEFSPAEIVQDRIFFSALLTSEASISVTVGGVPQSGGGWTWKPDDRVGVYHGSVPFSGTGNVVVTLVRNGAQIAQINGRAIGGGCPASLYNAWVGSAPVAGSVSRSPTLPLSQQTCVSGIGVNNFGGLCGYACQFGYCPISACTCRQMGKPITAPKETGIQGYPITGEDASYSGLCSWVCNHGYCPSSACGTTKVPLTIPDVSDFAPPACRQGTGQGGLLGLCQYSCNFGYCPRNACTCTAQGALISSPPADQRLTATGIAGLEDQGLCQFACNTGYCPDVCVSSPQPKALEDDFTAALKLNGINVADFANYNLSDLSTRLIGWDECTAAKGRPWQTVYSGWQQSWKIMNLIYSLASKGINFNEASAVEYLGAPGSTLSRRQDFKDIFLNLATIQPGYIFDPFAWKIAVRCDDWALQCTCKLGSSKMQAYTVNFDPKYKRASINFCDAYFASDTLDQAMENANKGYPLPYWADLTRYEPNQGATWFHELLHIDWVSLSGDYGDNERVVDLKLSFPHKPSPLIYDAYSPYLCKALARLRQNAADWTIRNADSLTVYALANYVQNKMENLYPHLPLAPLPPDSAFEPFVDSDLFSITTDGTVTLASNTTLLDEVAWDGSGVCAAIDDGDSSNTDPSAFLTISGGGFALQSDYPADYLSSLSSWHGLTPTTTKSAPTPTATWRMAIYSEKDCSGDYYSLDGHNIESLDMPCLALRGGSLPQTSDDGATCRWFTKGGGAWDSCEKSTLTHPLSWIVFGGTCTAYDTSNTCSHSALSQAYTPYEGCHNYDASAFDIKNWVSLRCGAFGAKKFANGTTVGNGTAAGGNATVAWSSRPVSLPSISTLRTSYVSSVEAPRPTAMVYT